MSVILSDDEIPELLQRSETIAVVGCSPNPQRTSNRIARFLMDKGYEVIPVNPGHDQMLGRSCYRNISEIPTHIKPDIFNVFRNSAYTEGFIKEVMEWKHKRDTVPVVWTQLGVSSEQAEQLAVEEGIPYIPDRCILVEINRYS